VHSGPLVSVDEEQKSAVQRIAESAPFRRSPRIRELFLYITDCSLSGRNEDLSETKIGERVFGRDNYHSSEDNIVRVSARQLRSKLAEYYETDGKQDGLVLEIPKGGYRAVFHTKHPLVADAPMPVPKNSRTITLVLAAVCVVLAVAVAFLWRQNLTLQVQKQPASLPTLFTPVAHSGSQRTNIILTDSALILWQSLIQRNVGVEEYAGSAYFQEAPGMKALPGKFLQTLRSRQISSLADLRIVAQISQSADQRGIYLHHSRNVHVRDFDSDDNFVIIGSARSNPWASLFEKNLKFTTNMAYGSSCFDNQRPLPGEPARYCPQDAEHEQGIDYARVAVMQNGHHAGRVVLIAGSLMESTEAAGEFFLNPDSLPQLEAAFHAKRPQDLPDYEVLLETRSVGGAGRSPTIVMARPIPGTR